MKIYNHSYLLPGEAEKRLYEAQQLLKSDNRKEALQRVNEARALLVEYLAKDNVEEIKDGTGFLRQSETFDDWQNFLIRETFAKKLEADTYSPNARQYLDIINVCQLQSGFPEFESVQHFINNRETFWADIEASGEESKPQTISKNKCLDKIGVAQNILDCLNNGWQYQTADGTVHEYTDSERKAMFEKAYSDLNEVYNYVYYQS